MDEPTDLMREGEVMGSLSLNEANIRNSQRLRRRTSSASSRSQSESPVKSVLSRERSKSSGDSMHFDEKEDVTPDVIVGSIPLKNSVTPPRHDKEAVKKTKATTMSSDSYFFSLFTMCWVTEQPLSRSGSSPSLVEGEALLSNARKISRSSSRNSVHSSGGSLRDRNSPLVGIDRHRVLSRENLKSLCKERKRESREQVSKLINENSSLLLEGSIFGDSSRSSKNDTMSEASTSVSLEAKKKRRRKRKKKRGSSIANDSTASTSTTLGGDDEKIMDDSISTITNDTNDSLHGGNYLILIESDAKNGSQGDTDEEKSEDTASEFVSIMEGGMTLLVITALGSTNPVVVTTDGKVLSWCLKRKQGESKSISLDNISGVELGMPQKLQKYFTAEDQERAFCLVLNGGKSASFLAPTSLERNALAQGFDALIRRRLMINQDTDFDLGLDIDAVHIRDER